MLHVKQQILHGLACILLCTPLARAQLTDSQRTAKVKELEALGATVNERTENGKTFICEVIFREGDYDDRHLALLSDLTKLDELVIGESSINGTGLQHLEKCQELSVLSVFNSPIDDESLRHIGRLNGLRELTLTKTRITDAGLAHLKNVPDLRHVHLPLLVNQAVCITTASTFPSLCLSPVTTPCGFAGRTKCSTALPT